MNLKDLLLVFEDLLLVLEDLLLVLGDLLLVWADLLLFANLKNIELILVRNEINLILENGAKEN